MSTAYLLTGGNMGNRFSYLQEAQNKIAASYGKITAVSAVYETDAWGVTDQPSFYNQALAVATSLSPDALMEGLLRIEQEMGRTRLRKMGPRIIDLDILLIDELVRESPLLTLPHPALHLRRFALLPLSEIAPDIIHPVLHKSIHQLLEDCTDTLNVQKKSAGAD